MKEMPTALQTALRLLDTEEAQEVWEYLDENKESATEMKDFISKDQAPYQPET